MNTSITLALATLGLLASGAQAAGNLVNNGSFELGAGGIGSFSGWQVSQGDAATFVDSSGQTGSHAGQASDGLWSAYFGSSAAAGGASISQLLVTVPGQTYVLSFDIANDNAGGAAANAFSANLGGTTLASYGSLGAQDYLHRQFSYTATGANSLLAFYASNDNGYLQLDHVSLIAAVPEPAVAVMWLAGLGGLLLAARRRRAGVSDC